MSRMSALFVCLQCVVQYYLKWLEDADYDPVCVLCTKSIQEGGDVVRLVCYDVYHVACLDTYAQSLPANSPPATFLCPKCKDPLLPPSNMVSPVANRLRQVLQAFNWVNPSTIMAATSNHGLSEADNDMYEEEEGPDGGTPHYMSPLTSTPRPPHPSTHPSLSSSLPPPPPPPTHSTDPNSLTTTVRGVSGGMSVRDSYPAATGLTLSKDVDDNKYRRKNPLEMVSRWIKYQHHWRLPSDDSTVIMRRYILMAVCVVFFVTVAIVMLTRVGRGVADRDPSLDWRTNPNLKTGD